MGFHALNESIELQEAYLMRLKRIASCNSLTTRACTPVKVKFDA